MFINKTYILRIYYHFIDIDKCMFYIVYYYNDHDLLTKLLFILI